MGKGRNVLLHLGLTLFCLTLVSVWSLSGIYAKYCKESSDSDNARVASFSVAANGVTQDADGLAEDYKITLENNSETAVSYDIKVTVSNKFSDKVNIKLGDIAPTVNGKVYTFSNAGNLSVNSTAEKNLTFSIDENSFSEMAVGGSYDAECPFDVEVTFTQID